jgi:hypothetical protein
MHCTRIVKSYSRAVGWLRADPGVRVPLSRQRRSDYRRIAALPPPWGHVLDELGAPYYLVRWVAGPGLRQPVLREQRWLAARAALRRPDGFAKKHFGALRAAHPLVEPRHQKHRLAAASARSLDVL